MRSAGGIKVPEKNNGEIGNASSERQLDSFLAKYTPEIQLQAEAILAKMRARLPHALQLVYDNYNALAIGFGPTERASDAIFSIALYPRWVSLFFLQSKGLPDPAGLLQGNGSVVRYIVLDGPEHLDSPEVQQLVEQALTRARVPLDPMTKHRIIIKSISANQRPRRPADEQSKAMRVKSARKGQ